MALSKHDIYPMDFFLKNNVYYIPNYQREYSWEENELDDFWRDLEMTVNEPDDIEHFFGQVVVHNDQEKLKNIIYPKYLPTMPHLIRTSCLNFQNIIGMIS